MMDRSAAGLGAGSPSRRAVRLLLHKLLPLAQDLDALCIDYLPDVEARFGPGWDLLSKQNLLLKLVSTEKLLTVLKDRFRGNAEAEGLIQEVCNRAVAPTKEELDTERRERELEQHCRFFAIQRRSPQ